MFALFCKHGILLVIMFMRTIGNNVRFSKTINSLIQDYKNFYFNGLPTYITR